MDTCDIVSLRQKYDRIILFLLASNLCWVSIFQAIIWTENCVLISFACPEDTFGWFLFCFTKSDGVMGLLYRTKAPRHWDLGENMGLGWFFAFYLFLHDGYWEYYIGLG